MPGPRLSRRLLLAVGLSLGLVAALCLGIALLTGPAPTAGGRAPTAEVTASTPSVDGSTPEVVAVDEADPSSWLDAPVPTTTEGPRAHPPSGATATSSAAGVRKGGRAGVVPGGKPRPGSAPRPGAPTGATAPGASTPTPSPKPTPPTSRPTPKPTATATTRPTTQPTSPRPSPTCRPRGSGQDPQHPLPRCPKD